MSDAARHKTRGAARLRWCCVIAAGLAIGTPGTAGAQSVPDLPSVREQSAPNYRARGTRFGAAMVYLSVGVRQTYNDNIFATDDEPAADFVTKVRPRARIVSDWRRHRLGGEVEAKATRHARNSDENVVDYGARLDGYVDVGRRGRLGAEVSASRAHEDRLSPNDPNGETRTPIRRYAADATAQQRIGRLGLSFAGSYESLDFGDVDARNDANADEINNDDRDRRVTRVAGRIGYGLSARYEPFLQAAYDRVSYDAERDDVGLDRDSKGMEISAGSRYRPNGFTVVEARLGFRRQNLDDPSLGNVEGLTAELSLLSNLTPATTLDVTGHRLVQQSTLTSTSAFFSTRLHGQLHHALRPDLLIGAEAALARHTFQGIFREDLIFGAGLNARYDPSPFLRLSLDYGFTKRASNADAAFQRNRITLGAEVRY